MSEGIINLSSLKKPKRFTIFNHHANRNFYAEDALCALSTVNIIKFQRKKHNELLPLVYGLYDEVEKKLNELLDTPEIFSENGVDLKSYPKVVTLKNYLWVKKDFYKELDIRTWDDDHQWYGTTVTVPSWLGDYTFEATGIHTGSFWGEKFQPSTETLKNLYAKYQEGLNNRKRQEAEAYMKMLNNHETDSSRKDCYYISEYETTIKGYDDNGNRI